MAIVGQFPEHRVTQAASFIAEVAIVAPTRLLDRDESELQPMATTLRHRISQEFMVLVLVGVTVKRLSPRFSGYVSDIFGPLTLTPVSLCTPVFWSSA